MIRFLSALAAVWMACAPALAVMPVPRPNPGRYRLGRIPGMPLAFQRAGAHFVATGADYRLSVSSSETVLRFEAGFGDVDHWAREEEFRLQLLGAARNRRHAPVDTRFEAAAFPEVYPHIHLECTGTPERLEYRFATSSGADPARIRLRLDGVQGLRVQPDGSVRAATPLGEVRIFRPAVEDPFDGSWRVVDGAFVVRTGGLVEFRPLSR